MAERGSVDWVVMREAYLRTGSELGAVTALVLLPAATGTRIVPPNVAPGNCLLRLSDRSWDIGAPHGWSGFRRLDMEKMLDRVSLDGIDQLAEKHEPLPLILDQRIALAHRPETNPRPEVVHLGKVFPPLIVDNVEGDLAFELPQYFGSQFLLALGVGGSSLFDRYLRYLLDIEAIEIVAIEVGLVELTELLVEQLPVPFGR
jgi:hypothetical protein